MGDPNQLLYLKRTVGSVAGPVLEIGSKDYGNTEDFRAQFPHCEYIGLDMEAGIGVDVVHDLTKGIGPLQRDYFELVICCSVLEHVKRPWVFAEHVSTVVQDGGILFMSVPWVWRYHPYPDDYFRFSWRGIEELFPSFCWHEITYSTTALDDFIPAGPGVDNSMAVIAKTQHGARKCLPYLMVNMVGYKEQA